MQVPDSDQMLAEGCTKMYGRTAKSSLHHVDACRPPVEEVAAIPDHPVFLVLLNDKVLGYKVDGWKEGNNPSEKRDDIVMSSFIIYSFQNFGYVLSNGIVVKILVEGCKVGLGRFIIEICGSTYCHSAVNFSC